MAQVMQNDGSARRNWHPVLWAAIAAVLIAPVVAMQFTREVAWGGEDFAMAAALLVGAGMTFELAARRIVNRRRLASVGLGIAAVVMLIWAEAAVGIFGG